jgi:flagellar biosynthetic protein FlhB
MAGDGEERTEAATEKRRQEARDKGQIARSVELSSALLLLGSLLTLNAAGPALGQSLADTMGGVLGHLEGVGDDVPSFVATIRALVLRTLGSLGGVIGALAAIALAVGAAQARGTFTTEPLTPDFTRLDPIKGLQRLFGGTRSLVELAKSILKLVLVGLVVWTVVRDALPVFGALAQQDVRSLFDVARGYGSRLLGTAGLAFLALAAADLFYQRRQYEKELRMTKQEVKQEAKSSEGDPMIKSRRRAVARQRLRQQMFAAVPKASVVIVNPTHIAIALRYDPTESPAPIVVAMGERKVAERIKKLALEHGVPVVQNKPLARAMIKACQVGMSIPVELYTAVAEVLAFVFRRRAAGGAWTGSAVA